MRPEGPTHWRLDGRTGWRTAATDGVDVEPNAIALDPRPGSERDLAARDGSLGGLRLPVGTAVAPDGMVLVLDPAGDVIRRRSRSGDETPVLGRGAGPGAGDPVDDRTLRGVTGIAVAGAGLLTVDPVLHRLSEFGLHSWELRRQWSADPVTGADWQPLAVTAVPSAGSPSVPGSSGGSGRAGAGFLLDGAAGRVWRIPVKGDPQLVVDQPESAGRWQGLAVDRDGRIYLYDQVAGRLDVLTPDGQTAGSVQRPGSVQDRFDVPAFPRTGRSGVRFRTTGRWTAQTLDSRIHRCVWDRVVLELSALPPGTTVTVATATVPELTSSTELPEQAWIEAGTVTGAALGANPDPDGEPVPVDLPVRSAPGRSLAVRLQLDGSGHRTPTIRAVRVYYPRRSPLELLPAVFGADPEAADFLQRFLGALQLTWDELENVIDCIPALFDPSAVPGPEPLRFLAAWFAVLEEARWDDAQQRAWLRANLAVLRRRGTPTAVRTVLLACLRNLIGDPLDVGPLDREPLLPDGYPLLVEGFRERGRLLLSGSAPAGVLAGDDPAVRVADRNAPLWSPSVVGRLRPGWFARVGEARLVSTGAPDQDLFRTYANRFTVYLPASWVRSDEDERTLRRVLAAEQPASTRADLCLVQPRLRVGNQASVGLDTIIGAVPRGRLGCAQRSGPAAGRHSANARLGHDLVLGRAAAGPLRIPDATASGPGLRVGTGTAIR